MSYNLNNNERKPIDQALTESKIIDLLLFTIEGNGKDLYLVMASPIGQTMSFGIQDPYISVDGFFNLLSERYKLGTPEEIKNDISNLLQ